MSFPQDFVWGVATASYQVEGSATTAGGGMSVWDMHVRRPGAIAEGDTGDIACDHYNHWQEDVALLQQIGVQGYRFSISWPRVIPSGVGGVNQPGLDFYDRLVDALLAARIQPWVTLFHWDYPFDLYLRGGWLNPDSSDWFAEYATVIVDKLGDRVKHWMTINEPQVFIGMGHRDGIHAPGDKLALAQVLRVGHNSLLAHGKGVQVIRARAKTPPLVGFAPVGHVFFPFDPGSLADIEAARAAMFSMNTDSTWNNTWWLDPPFFGHYPEDGLRIYGSSAPTVRPGDMETIAQPLDFFGQNTYLGMPVRAGKNAKPEVMKQPTGISRTLYDWPVTPDALYWGAKFYYERYGKPIVVTENGLSNMDWIALDGKVHDPQRIDYTARYLRGLSRAVDEGIEALGYFHWSFMDNFEWQEGYKQRFGLVYIEPGTLRRVPKDSAYWYQEVIRSNGASLGA